MNDLAEINTLKYEIAKVAASSKEGHIASAYSIMDLLWVLYKKILKVEVGRSLQGDQFILSKGHASLALYAIFVANNIITLEEFQSFGRYESRLGGHPDCNKLEQITASTGSLGHGLPIATGIAMAYKIREINSRVFCLVGDGECNEGTIWESALLASHHKLGNLYCIVDFNHSTDRALSLGDLEKKFLAFGWDVISIDGHNHSEIFNAFSHQAIEKPVAIIANTIKGKGVGMMEGEPAWHHRNPTEQELEQIQKELSSYA
ncbi:transketolase [Polynucleobacter paneuropaeus]|nr:transketolase [Polynucleobacter paneuropaeus]MBT8587025.1 transketolase [Polynucleobacter paneuropaeus]MBT8599693.1 transketolase [Polynucleobacter paneuropaeus]